MVQNLYKIIRKENLLDFGLVCEVKKGPGSSGRASVLAGHEKGNHHVSNFVIGYGLAISVFLSHKSSHHVVVVL